MLDQAKLTPTLGLFAWNVLTLTTLSFHPSYPYLVDSYMVVSLMSPPERLFVAYV